MRSLIAKWFGNPTESADSRFDRLVELQEKCEALKQSNSQIVSNYNVVIGYLNGLLVRAGGEVYLDDVTLEAGGLGTVQFEKQNGGGVVLTFLHKEMVEA